MLWLGHIPAHWELTRLKYLLSGVGAGGTPDTDKEGYWSLDDSGTPWVAIGDLSGRANVLETAKSLTGDGIASKGLTIWPPGTLLFSMYASLGHTAELMVPAAINQAILALQPTKQTNQRFLNRWLEFLKPRLKEQASSNTQDNLNAEKVRNLLALAIPIEEQTAIAAFLDREAAKIDALIAEQEKLIALLAEKRQATISHVVTRGLNPAAPMKDSGVEWLGEVPAHWVITSLGKVASERCDGPFGSGIKSEHYTEEGAIVVRLQNIRAGAFNIGEPVYLDMVYFQSELRHHEVFEGDLLVAGLGDGNNLLGRACVAPEGLGPALVKADCFRFRLNTEQAISEFVAWQLNAGAAYDAGVLATGTTRSRIPLSTMASRKVALPPAHEQRAVADFIRCENSKLDALSLAADRAILLLGERRSALIAAAVTGQIDVRNV
ncbi:restriction endonuclease subunit S [Silvimonas amylolytica]|nr:restriction endonuclease subunit S [Silvimonas amylolytica]